MARSIRERIVRGTAGRRAVALLAAAFGPLAAAPPLEAAEVVYRYIDDQGVVHFSNAPADRRYEPIALKPRGYERSPRPQRGLPSFSGYDALIEKVAKHFLVEPGLVKAVIAAESNFDADAVSHKGAEGLMQLMPATARALGVRDSLHPVQNVVGGVRYLREMLDRYGDVSRALAAYNAGPTAVDRHGGIPPYRETRAYVKRVLTYYRGYHAEFVRPESARTRPGAPR